MATAVQRYREWNMAHDTRPGWRRHPSIEPHLRVAARDRSGQDVPDRRHNMKAVPIVAAVCGALLIAGCSQSPAPSVPSASAPFTLPSPAVSANSGFSLTGVVSDATTGHPIVGA